MERRRPVRWLQSDWVVLLKGGCPLPTPCLCQRPPRCGQGEGAARLLLSFSFFFSLPYPFFGEKMVPSAIPPPRGELLAQTPLRALLNSSSVWNSGRCSSDPSGRGDPACTGRRSTRAGCGRSPVAAAGEQQRQLSASQRQERLHSRKTDFSSRICSVVHV